MTMRYAHLSKELDTEEMKIMNGLTQSKKKKALPNMSQNCHIRKSQSPQSQWAHLDLNQGPPACEAGVLPLNYEPTSNLLLYFSQNVNSVGLFFLFLIGGLPHHFQTYSGLLTPGSA